MKIIIFQSDGAAGEKEQLRELPLSPDEPGADPFVKASVTLRDGSAVELSAVHSLASMSLSLLVTREGRHVATAMCRWREVAPYFAVRLEGGPFVELYFER